MEKTSLRQPWLWLGLGGVLWVCANGNWAVPAAAWPALALLLRYSRTRSSWRELAPLAAVLVASDTAFLWPMLSLEMIPPAMRFATGALWGMIAFLPFVLDHAIGRRLTGMVSTLVFPMAFASVEWLYSLSPDGSWGALAYTQYGSLPLLQLVALTGPWGVTFVVAWFAATVNTIWEADLDLSRAEPAAAVYGGCLALVLICGGMRLAFVHPEGPGVDIAGVTNPPDFPTYFDMAHTRGPILENQEQWAHLLRQSVEAARAGAKVIVWQEYALFINQGTETHFLEIVGRVAKEAGVHLVVCYGLKPEDDFRVRWRNRLAWIGPNGAVVGTYDKAHPSSALEPLVPAGATAPLVVDTAWGRIAAIICTDQDFPGLVRQAGATGSGLLLVPSAAWPQVVPLHTHMANFRALENGFSLFKVTGQGESAVFDPLGRVVARRGQPGMMLVRLPVVKMGTGYGLWGDGFGAVCLVGLFLLAIWRWRKGWK